MMSDPSQSPDEPSSEAPDADLPPEAADQPAVVADPAVSADHPVAPADQLAVPADLPAPPANQPSVAADLPAPPADQPSAALPADQPAVAPEQPAMPPAKRPRRSGRSPWWAKAALTFGIVLILAAASGLVLVRVGVAALNRAVPTAHLLSPEPSAVPKLVGDTIKGPINILMVGVDASGHTDSIIIAHVPANHDRVYLVSVPRDLDVATLEGGHNKINSTYSGPSPMSHLQQTIAKNLGITVNAALLVNFGGFAQIVDKLGGVDVYVDETTYSIHHGYVNNNPADHYKGYPYRIDTQTGVPICSIPGVAWSPSTADECTIPGVKEVVYPKGLYHFDGYSALDWVRCRDGLIGTDYGRQRHQQQFIKAVMKKVYDEGLADPFKLLGLIQSFGRAFTFDNNGVPLTNWVLTLDAVGPSNLITIKTNDGRFDSLPDTGHGAEQGLTADSQTLFADIKNDTDQTDLVGDFITTHPGWVSNS